MVAAASHPARRVAGRTGEALPSDVDLVWIDCRCRHELVVTSVEWFAYAATGNGMSAQRPGTFSPRAARTAARPSLTVNAVAFGLLQPPRSKLWQGVRMTSTSSLGTTPLSA